MIAHNDVQREAVEIVAIDGQAFGIVDLCDVSALRTVGIDLEDALARWQRTAEAGGTPRSWTVRGRLIEVGANGLIDPSRKTPGLWHLVLFRWNVADAPSARLLATQRFACEATFHVEHRSSRAEQERHDAPVFHVEHRPRGQARWSRIACSASSA
ncbi:hypothetical protein [Curtobacterium flaccumfaciens]|uniref:hypothetical protein n=1 Tax=Curtobacterium flaccumfaciens TaxID=2035 RepID=UPI00220E26DA|nr:hypothetical protein [Curtobacterium flaccumfaciens]UWD79191.1 hypothetical protein NY058_17580 [Curtobacterium flaccumfaciens]